MSTFKLTHLSLKDNFPGAVNPNLGIPTGGWDNTTDNFVTTAAGTPAPQYDVGTKIMGYEDSSYCPGSYVMMYGMYHAYSSASDVEATDVSLGTAFCFHYDGSDAVKYGVDSSVVPWYVLAKADADAGVTDQTEGGGMAIPCATIDPGESSAAQVSGYGDSYCWFWVGGVCPVTDCTLFQGTGSGEDGPDISCATTLRSGPACAIDGTSNAGFEALIDSCDVSITQGDDASGGNIPTVIGWMCTSCV